WPPAERTSTLPTIGKVHEKETSTSVADIKKIPVIPPFSAARSVLFTSLYGALISNSPRKDRAKKMKMKKTNRFGIQWVASAFNPSAPKTTANKVPAIV